jgi:hypothetical protein
VRLPPLFGWLACWNLSGWQSRMLALKMVEC